MGLSAMPAGGASPTLLLDRSSTWSSALGASFHSERFPVAVSRDSSPPKFHSAAKPPLPQHLMPLPAASTAHVNIQLAETELTPTPLPSATAARRRPPGYCGQRLRAVRQELGSFEAQKRRLGAWGLET